jgi:hypothetical protein
MDDRWRCIILVKYWKDHIVTILDYQLNDNTDEFHLLGPCKELGCPCFLLNLPCPWSQASQKTSFISLHTNTLKASPLQQLFRGGGIVHSNLERAELYQHASLEVLSRDGDIALSVAIAGQLQGAGAWYMRNEAYAVANWHRHHQWEH